MSHQQLLINAEIANLLATVRRNQRFSFGTQQVSTTTIPYDYLSDATSSGSLKSNQLSQHLSLKPFPYSVYIQSENPVVRHFIVLKSRLALIKDGEKMDPVHLLEPFLEILKTGHANGPITNAALTSLEKFITFHVIDIQHCNLKKAISNLAYAATHCKFEATDTIYDEIVLIKLLKLFQILITSDCGKMGLDDKAVCEMLEATFGIHFQGRVSEQLRRTAEQTLVSLSRELFFRMNDLISQRIVIEPLSETSKNYGWPAIMELLRVLNSLLDPQNKQHSDSTHRAIALILLNNLVDTSGQFIESLFDWTASLHGDGDGSGSKRFNRIRIPTEQKLEDSDIASETVHITTDRPATLVSVSGEINPENSSQATQEVVVDVSPVGVSESIPVLVTEEVSVEKKALQCLQQISQLILDDISKNMCQILVQANLSSTNPPSPMGLYICVQVVRYLTSIYRLARHHLFYQRLWFIDWMVKKINSGVVVWDTFEESKPANPQAEHHKIISTEVREIFLDSIVQFCSDESFFAELFVHSDGNAATEDHFFEDIIRFLAKHAFPDATPGGSVTANIHQMLCFEALLHFLNAMYRTGESVVAEQSFSPLKVLEMKQMKRLLKQGVNMFNEDPKVGISFFHESGFLSSTTDSSVLAKFLKVTPGVNKKKLGEFLSKPSNLPILKAFIEQFSFTGLRIDEALRLLLESFRLPGESQQIERIMETFANTFFLANKDKDQEIETETAAFILSYSVIMLNTDQHNPQVRRRMTFEDFYKNSRGINNGKNFSEAYMQRIFDAIKENEIVMPEEHEGEKGFPFAWANVMKQTRLQGPVTCASCHLYKRDMLSLVWWPLVGALCYGFDNAEDSLYLQKSIVAFSQIGELASKYRLNDMLDSLIISLIKMTGLQREYQVDYRHFEEKTQKRIDRWVCDFGNFKKGQLACICLFNLVADYGNFVSEGWKNLVDSLKNLYLHCLLPEHLTVTEDEDLQGRKILPLKSRLPAIESPSKKVETSILGTLSQFLSLGTYEEVPLPEDIEATQVAQRCIQDCQLELLLKNSRFLELDSLKRFIMAILENCLDKKIVLNREIPEEAKEVRDSTKDHHPLISEEERRPSKIELPQTWDFTASAPFLLELLFRIASENKARLDYVWPFIQKFSNELLKNSKSEIQLVEQYFASLFRLIGRVSYNENLVQMLFESAMRITILEEDVFSKFTDHLITVFGKLCRAKIGLFNIPQRISLLSTILTRSASNPDTCGPAFDIACSVIGEKSYSIVNEDNFGDCIDLMLYFSANAGNIVANFSTESTEDMAKKPKKKTIQRQAAIERGVKSLEVIFKLHTKISKILDEKTIKSERAWFEFWLPILSGLGQQCYHPAREVRQQAFTLLQKALLLPELLNESALGNRLDILVGCFENVLFPLMEELLKPEVFKFDPSGMDETQIRSVGVLSKVFLHYLPQLITAKELMNVWIRILEHITYLIHVRESVLLSEAISEALKNMVLVMKGNDAFGSDLSTSELWNLTWAKMGKVFPQLQSETLMDK